MGRTNDFEDGTARQEERRKTTEKIRVFSGVHAEDWADRGGGSGYCEHRYSAMATPKGSSQKKISESKNSTQNK